MSKYTQASRGQTCTIRVPGICNFNPETTVSAHLSGVRFGHGVGRKVNDIHAADACSACHDAVDGRIKTMFSKIELKVMHLEGVIETQIRRIKDGLIKL